MGLQSLIISAEAVTRAALMREESRGGHTGVDFPGESNEWLKYWVVSSKNSDGSMKTDKAGGSEGIGRDSNAKIEDLEK